MAAAREPMPVEKGGDQDADGEGQQLVLENRQRIAAEKGAGENRDAVDRPEAEDRLQGQLPVGEPVPLRGGDLMQRVGSKRHVHGGLGAAFARGAQWCGGLLAEAGWPLIEGNGRTGETVV
jgi:hypothetical protein